MEKHLEEPTNKENVFEIDDKISVILSKLKNKLIYYCGEYMLISSINYVNNNTLSAIGFKFTIHEKVSNFWYEATLYISDSDKFDIINKSVFNSLIKPKIDASLGTFIENKLSNSSQPTPEELTTLYKLIGKVWDARLKIFKEKYKQPISNRKMKFDDEYEIFGVTSLTQITKSDILRVFSKFIDGVNGKKFSDGTHIYEIISIEDDKSFNDLDNLGLTESDVIERLNKFRITYRTNMLNCEGYVKNLKLSIPIFKYYINDIKGLEGKWVEDERQMPLFEIFLGMLNSKYEE